MMENSLFPAMKRSLRLLLAAPFALAVPLAAQVWQQLNALMGAGWGREDTSSLLRVLER